MVSLLTSEFVGLVTLLVKRNTADLGVAGCAVPLRGCSLRFLVNGSCECFVKGRISLSGVGCA